MSIVNGTIEKVFFNDKSDAIVVQGKKITLKKGRGKGLTAGALVNVLVEQGEWQGKTTYMAKGEVNVEAQGSAPPPSNSNGGGYRSYSTPEHTDLKSESICFQSALKTAMEFIAHTQNMSKEQKDDVFKELLSRTYQLARLSTKPELFRPNPNAKPNLDTTATLTEETSDDYAATVL